MVFSIQIDIFTNMIKTAYNILALMSGTSLDGIDIIEVQFDFKNVWEFKIKHYHTYKYPKKWLKILTNLTSKTKEELLEIDQAYSKYLADVVLKFITTYKVKKIDFVASHGHTALHQPDKGLTYQIGNTQTFANLINQKLICDFRTQDVALGGQGAPLVPIGDKLLFGAYDYCINLGGFANISFENNLQERIAFDICPVNIVLNYYTKKIGLDYDDGGNLAKSGIINQSLLKELNNLEFYQTAPPKSLGLEWVQTHIFGLIDGYALKTEDILSTFVAHVAFQIGLVLKGNGRFLITGGGAYNTFLINQIQATTRGLIKIPAKEIIEFKEALIFGLLGILKDRNEINCLSSVTGARKNHCSGTIFLPKN